MEERICGSIEFWAWSGTREVMDGDSGDEGNNELMCVRSNKSGKSRWSVGRWSSLGSWLQSYGNAWWKERLLTFREEEEGGREMVETSEEPVLRWGWREIRLYTYEGWVVVRTLYLREKVLWSMRCLILSQSKGLRAGLITITNRVVKHKRR